MDAGDKTDSGTSHPTCTYLLFLLGWSQSLGCVGLGKEPQIAEPGRLRKPAQRTETSPSCTRSSRWNIITWTKKLRPHLQASCPVVLSQWHTFLPSYAAPKDQGKDCASRGQRRKFGFSLLLPSTPTPHPRLLCPESCPQQWEIQSAPETRVFLGESTSASVSHSSECRTRYPSVWF